MILKMKLMLVLSVTFACGTPKLNPIQKERLNRETTYTISTGLDANSENRGDYVKEREYAFADDNVLASYYIPIRTEQDSLALSELDMEDSRDILACVGANKYLTIAGNLTIPVVPETYGVVDIGCLDISMNDNLYYLEQTKLVVVTDGIKGERIQQIQIPLQIDHNGWHDVPSTPGFFDLEIFSQETIKKFSNRVCFQLEFGEVPAQAYSGEIQIHYLKPDNTPNYEDELEKRCSPVEQP